MRGVKISLRYIDPGVKISYDILTPGSIYRGVKISSHTGPLGQVDVEGSVVDFQLILVGISARLMGLFCTDHSAVFSSEYILCPGTEKFKGIRQVYVWLKINMATL